jgi:hypothetical protein
MKKSDPRKYLDWTTHVEEVQAQPRAHQSEAVASGANQGAAAPTGPPHAGGSIMTPRGGLRWFPILSPANQPQATI